ncbi:MAG TPA: hypothetical protein VHD61_15635 [Lacunisphaera sp.]|nr:hypothetical protein [Lacunisphaera sp.]
MSESAPHSASGVNVWCTFSRLCPVGELKPHPSNTTKHPPKQLAVYVELLRTAGWRRPITVSTRSGYIVRGHGARLAALEMGSVEVPVEFQDYPSEAAELADLVADNRLPELAQTDKQMLAKVLAQIGSADVITGYDPEFIKNLLGAAAPEPQYPITARLNERHDYVVIVVDSETDWQFLTQLVGVQMERSYKNSIVGQGRVIPFARFIHSLRANSHSITPPRVDHDDAPAAG